MNKSELIKAVAAKTGITSKVASEAVSATFDVIAETLTEGNPVSVLGFGTFEVRTRAEHQGRNPSTGETITVKASKSPAFKPGRALKESVNK